MNETEKKTFSAPSPGELEQLTELHKAMGDYTRMRILWYLMQKDSCVSELAQKMEVTESAIRWQGQKAVNRREHFLFLCSQISPDLQKQIDDVFIHIVTVHLM